MFYYKIAFFISTIYHKIAFFFLLFYHKIAFFKKRFESADYTFYIKLLLFTPNSVTSNIKYV